MSSEFLNLVINISGKYRSKIDKIVNPLAVTFGIDAHCYYCIDEEGGGTYLSTHPEIAENFFENKLYKTVPFLKHPSLEKPGWILTEDIKPDGIELNHHLVLFEKENDVLHCHCFATTQCNNNLRNIYLNNLDRLKSFCGYFREETKALQAKANDKKVNLPELLGDSFFEPNSLGPSHTNEEYQDFFHTLYKARNPDRYLTPLSNREMECLKYLLLGKSASQIALELNLKERTVEHYMESIKYKLSCFTKADIFELVDSIKSMGGDLSYLKYSPKKSKR